jgi:hypothetical protein
MPKKTRVRAKFKPDYRAFHRFATSDQMLRPLYEAAHDIRVIAAATSPRSDGAGPHYADEYKVDSRPNVLRIGRFSRRIVTVVNESPKAAPNEFDNKRSKGGHHLGKAGAQIGDYRGAMEDD